ncbi:MAG: hypothetical protein M3R06_08430, partial [Chloroflexota bacterium]|nr:hypothetical protein [Chloroflexota bacterium]
DLDLLWEVTRLTGDKELREVLGSEEELLRTICIKLALAPKDRTADYVYCSSTKLPAATDEREQLRATSRAEQISIAATLLEPLMKRFTASSLACTVASRGEVMIRSAVEELLAALPHACPAPLEQTILTLAEQRAHPFSLTLVLIWSQYHWTGGANGISVEPVPEPEYLRGIPLYVFDKHTSVGKRALGMLADRCPEVREVLQRWVPDANHADVVRMAAFYADAAPISRRLEWFAGRHMEFIGLHADLMSVGCSYEAVRPVMECVWHNLAAVNQLRREILLR